MQEELKEFGLTENEVKIYLALLELKIANPSEITEKTGFSRSYVYDALERLLEKQMVSSILKNNKKHYIATDPKRLEELAKQRLEKIQKIIPKLIGLQKVEKEEIKVELHKGTYIYKTLLKDIITTLNKNDNVLIFGIKDEELIKQDKYYKDYINQYFARLNKLNIKEKVITTKGIKPLKNAKTTSYKFLPKKDIGNTAFEVYGNKVGIFLWGKPHYLILITNKKVADSYKNQFNLLWKIAKK